jgi:hypothetical protein
MSCIHFSVGLSILHRSVSNEYNIILPKIKDMRKYVSLGSAMMMGVVLGKEKLTYEFAQDGSNRHATIDRTIGPSNPSQPVNPVRSQVAPPPQAMKGFYYEASPATSVASSHEKVREQQHQQREFWNY